MSLPWESTSALAQELERQARAASSSGQPSDAQEARLRSAISRAYYAAFWCCRDYWRHSQPQHPLPSDGTAHFEVRDRFERYSDPIHQNIAQNLKRLLDARRQADYDDTVPNLEQTATASLRWANRILTDTGSLA